MSKRETWKVGTMIYSVKLGTVYRVVSIETFLELSKRTDKAPKEDYNDCSLFVYEFDKDDYTCFPDKDLPYYEFRPLTKLERALR